MPAVPVLQGVIFMQMKGVGGWEERYIFNPQPSTRQGALAVLQQIVFGRTAFLGTDCQVDFARVSSTNSTRDGSMCELDYPLGPHPSWAGGTAVGDVIAPPNDKNTCVQMRLETTEGKFWNRYYHCVPDSWVANQRLTTGIIDYLTPATSNPAGIDMSPAGGLGHKQICKAFWRYLLDNTAYAHTTDRINYEIAAFQFVKFRKVADKSLGRIFGQSRGRRPKFQVG